MAIEDRNLAVGTKLWAKYKGQVHTAEVVEELLLPEGKAAIRYQLADGQRFKSPSAAGTAITGKSCNGWAFWSVGEPPAAKTTELEATETKPKRTRKERNVSRDGNGHVLPIVEQVDGTFECANCSATFPTREEAAAHIGEAHPAEQPADEQPA
jgi:hypothetical protein